jgi:hypothetical protein
MLILCGVKTCKDLPNFFLNTWMPFVHQNFTSENQRAFCLTQVSLKFSHGIFSFFGSTFHFFANFGRSLHGVRPAIEGIIKSLFAPVVFFLGG